MSSYVVRDGKHIAIKILNAAPPKLSKKPFKARFTKFPDLWAKQLATVDAGKHTYRVALHLLHEAWRTGSRTIKLANEVLERKGVDRKRKSVALQQLREAGLIGVEERPKKSPIVTVWFLD
jgi:hypothetical protein